MKKLANVLKYLLSASVGLGLLWYLFQNVDTEGFMERIGQLDYSWIVLSIIFSLISHYARAYRWNLMLYPQGYRITGGRSFIAVMSGYFGNLFVPRMGEVFRCLILKRTDDVPVANSFGAVVAERVLDLLILIGIVITVLLAEKEKIQELFTTHIVDKIFGAVGNIPSYVPWVVVGGILVFLLLFLLVRRKLRKFSLYIKVKNMLSGIIEGILSIRKVHKPVQFWISTIVIWLMYYLMSYVIVFTMPETSSLPALAGLSILMMGGLGMAAPVQGGFGTYHLMVSAVLVIYGIQESDGLFFATVLHTSQTLAVLFFGGISALTALFIPRKSAKVIVKNEDQYRTEDLQPQGSR